MAEDLIDEYRLRVMPKLFGGGKRLFEDGCPRLPVTRIETTPIDTGAVVLHYRRDRAAERRIRHDLAALWPPVFVLYAEGAHRPLR